MRFRPALTNMLAGVLLCLGGLIATFFGGLPVAEFVTGNERGLAWADVAVGIFLAGTVAWWLLIGRSKRATWLRGAIAGALTGILSYPAVLAATALINFSFSAGGTIGQARSVTQLTGFGLLTTGFAAVPTMAAAGVVVVMLLRPLYPARHAADPGLNILRGAGTVLLVLAGLLVGGFVWLSVLPLDRQAVSGIAPAEPTLSFEQALAAFETARSHDEQVPINPRCASKLLLQDSRQAPTIIFLHGLTNCPAQADELAPMLFALGYNVYVPRLPGHGENDRMTEVLGRITARDYVMATEAAFDIGRGIGGPVVMMGLSVGGVLTLWSGQQNEDLDYALAMAPFLGPNLVPTWANRAATNLLLLLPNVMVDWDSQNPEGPPDMSYAYPRVASRAIGQFMLIGELTAELARDEAPHAKGLGVMVNEADTEVNRRLVDKLVDTWRRQGATVALDIVPLDLRLPHDLVDPRQEGANTEIAYGLIAKMLTDRTEATP